MTLGQYGDWRAVVEQVVQALRRVRRVNRHVTGARLEDRHQPDQGVQPTAGDDRHAIIRLHTQADQMLRQGIGLLIEFGVGQLRVGKHCRQRVRPFGHLCLETLLDGLCSREIHLGGIELEQYLRKLRRRQDRQLVDRCLRRLLQRKHEVFQRAVQVVADALWIGLGAGQQGQAETVTEVIDTHRQRIVAALF